MAVWLVRAGSHGEFQDKFPTGKRVYVIWDDLDVNLATLPDRAALIAASAHRHPTNQPKQHINHASQSQTRSKPVIEHCRREFLLQNHDPEVRCVRPENARLSVTCQVDRGGGWQELSMWPQFVSAPASGDRMSAQPILIDSPQQDRTLAITVDASRGDPTRYLTLIFEVRDKTTQAILHRQQTNVSTSRISREAAKNAKEDIFNFAASREAKS